MDTVIHQSIDFLERPDINQNEFFVIMMDGTEVEVNECEFYSWLRCSKYVGPWDDVDRDAGRPSFTSGESTVDDILEDTDLLKEAMMDFLTEMELFQ